VYNLSVLRPLIHTCPIPLALLVAAFVAFYPQLDAMGFCDDGGCPNGSHSAPASSSGASAGGSGGVSNGTSHGADSLAGGFTGTGPVAVLVAASAYLSIPAFRTP
jgi:hypothetical protein